jgi:hypothetical protein
MHAFTWFLGDNDLETPMIDADTGRCADGLHPDRVNENKGAESTIAYLLSLLDIRRLKRTATIHQMAPGSRLDPLAVRASAS